MKSRSSFLPRPTDRPQVCRCGPVEEVNSNICKKSVIITAQFSSLLGIHNSASLQKDTFEKVLKSQFSFL